MTAGLGPIFAVVAPVFLCAALGFLWARSGRSFDRAAISSLISSVGAPCLVFHNLVGLAARSAVLVEMAGAALLAILGSLVAAYLVLRLARLPSHTYLSPLVFSNAGNMGLAVCNFAFPENGGVGGDGLAFGACFFAVSSFLHFTLGVMLWSGRFSLRELARTPLAWSAVLSVVVVAAGVRIPPWLSNTTELLGAFSIPLMLITLGVALSELRIRSLARSGLLAGGRLGLGLAAGLGVAQLLDLQGVMRGVLIIQCAMPSAVFNVLFAEQYERSPEQVASLVVVSTLVSFVTLPLLLAVALGTP